MASIADALRRLRLAPERVSAKSKLPLRRVIALYEGADVTSIELRALARGLRIPIRAFAGSGRNNSDISLRFRNTEGSGVEFDPTPERIGAFLEASLAILPRRNAPPDWIHYFWEQSHRNFKDAEKTATSLREALYNGQETEPAIDLPQRLNGLEGVIVGQLPNSRYEGVSVVWNGYIFVFVSPRFVGRMLFTLGHELAHVVAHHAYDAPHYDLAGDIGRFRRSEEGYADAFSAAFLLPAAGVGQVLKTVRHQLRITEDQVGDVELLYLSRFFGVSFDVAALRCEHLDLLPRGGGAAIAARLRKEHRSPERRADALGLPPIQATYIDRIAPQLIEAAAVQVAEGEVSPTWLAERLGVSPEQLQAANAALRGRSVLAH